MATSGSKDFTTTFTRNNIIQTALRRLGVYDSAEAVPAAETADAASALNLMIKEWSATGVDIWVRREAIVFLEANKQSYLLGPSGDVVVDGVINSSTTLSATTFSATNITPVSMTDATAGTVAVVEMDDGTWFAATISTVFGSNFSLSTSIPGTASSGNKLYYTSATSTGINRPQQILYISRRSTSDLDAEIRLIGEDEYRLLSDKDASGPPVSAYYRSTLTNGTLFVWPVVPGSAYDQIVVTYTTTVDDYDDGNDTSEFPPEWANVISWNLAAELAAEYGLAETEQARLWTIANAKLNNAMDYDIEQASVIFSRDYGRV